LKHVTPIPKEKKMLNKRKVLLSAAIAGLFAASAVVTSTPVIADETQGQTGDKHSCKGGSCKGEEAAPAAGGADAAAPAEGAAPKAKKAKKAKAKKKKKAAASDAAHTDAPAGDAPAATQ
jgi:competence protein ComEA